MSNKKSTRRRISNVNRHADFISVLLRSSRKRPILRKILELATSGQINALLDCFELVFMRATDLPSSKASSFKRHAPPLQHLRARTTGLEEKKKILEQNGGFLSSLGEMLPTVIKGVETGVKYLADANRIHLPSIIRKMRSFKRRWSLTD